MEVSNGGTLYADRVTANNNVTAGLWVVGAGSTAHLLNSDIFANESNGVRVGDGSTAYVRNSDIFANKASGVRVREGGNVFADNVNAYSNGWAGMFAEDVGSMIYVRNSDIYSNSASGLYATDGASFYATHMHIYNNENVGVEVSAAGYSIGEAASISSYGYITDSLIYNNDRQGLRVELYMDEDDDKDPDNYLDLADFERKGETAPTLIAERVQVFNNGIADPEESFSGATNFGAIMKISDSSIWGNGWSGVWTAGWHGRADITNSDNIYYANGRTVLENVTIFDNLGNGVDSRGGQVTVTNSNVFGNTHDQYVNFTGLSHRDEFSTVFCIRSGGYVDVGPVRIGNNPIGASGGETPNCGLASEVTLSDPQTKPFPVFPAFPAFPSPFLP